MSIENISVSIDPSPLRTFVKTIISEELQPSLYGNDNSLAQLVQEEVAVSPRIHDRIVGIISDYTDKSEFGFKVKGIVEDNIQSLVRDNLDYSDLASEIDASDIASYIRMSRLAAEINAADIANEISLHDIASELSTSDIANEIDIENLADTIATQHTISIAAEVAEKINYKKLAAELLDVIAERSKSTTA